MSRIYNTYLAPSVWTERKLSHLCGRCWHIFTIRQVAPLILLKVSHIYIKRGRILFDVCMHLVGISMLFAGISMQFTIIKFQYNKADNSNFQIPVLEKIGCTSLTTCIKSVLSTANNININKKLEDSSRTVMLHCQQQSPLSWLPNYWVMNEAVLNLHWYYATACHDRSR